MRYYNFYCTPSPQIGTIWKRHDGVKCVFGGLSLLPPLDCSRRPFDQVTRLRVTITSVIGPGTALCSLPPSGCVFPTFSPPARPSPWGEINLLPAIRPHWRSRSSTNQPWACGPPFVSDIQPLQAQLVLVSTGAYSAETLNTTVSSWAP